MDLLIEAERLPRFFDLTPKVIVASGDALAGVLRDDAADPLFEVWIYTPAGPTSGVVRPQSAAEPTGRLVAVPNPPAATCLPAARTAEACEALERFRTWWAATGH